MSEGQAERLERELRKVLPSTLKLVRHKNGRLFLDSPHRLPDGDGLTICLEHLPNGKLLLSDIGNTLMRLSLDNDIDLLLKEPRAELLKVICDEHDVKFNRENGQFTVETNIEDLTNAITRLIRALEQVYGLAFPFRIEEDGR